MPRYSAVLVIEVRPAPNGGISILTKEFPVHVGSRFIDSPRVSVIIPARNEAEGIGAVIAGVRDVLDELGHGYEIIVVDDGSSDDTAERAHKAGALVLCHPYNIGNGAAIKTGIRNARGDALVMLDADGQHPPEQIPQLLAMLEKYHMAVGARNSESETSAHRNLANRVYNWFASYVCGRRIDDLTSGFRAVRAGVAREFVTLLPNTFSYPTTITMATVRSGYSLAYLPIKGAKRAGNSKSKIKLLRDGSRFFLIIFKISTLFSPLKIFVPASIVTFLAGVAYGLYKIFMLDGRYGPTSQMLIVFSMLMFLIGLVSEQITQLRFDRSIPFAGERRKRFVHQTESGGRSSNAAANRIPAAARGRAVEDPDAVITGHVSSRRLFKDSRGFTLMEGVAVLFLLGILVALSISGAASTTTYKQAADLDKLTTHLRYAQARSIDTNSTWGINFTGGNTYQLFQGTTATVIQLPGESANTVTLHALTVTRPATNVIEFDGFGRPFDGNGGALANTTVSTSWTHGISVTAVTGYIEWN